MPYTHPYMHTYKHTKVVFLRAYEHVCILFLMVWKKFALFGVLFLYPPVIQMSCFVQNTHRVKGCVVGCLPIGLQNHLTLSIVYPFAAEFLDMCAMCRLNVYDSYVNFNMW